MHPILSISRFGLIRIIIFIGIFCFELGSNHAHAQSCTPLFPSGTQAPGGYGASWNPFSNARELLLAGSCSGDTVNVTIGSDQPNQYVFNQGFYWNGTQWRQLPLQGSSPAVGNWIPRQGKASFSKGNQDPAIFVGYVCQYTDGAWKCGCADNACTTPHWQVQALQTETGSGDDTGESEIPSGEMVTNIVYDSLPLGVVSDAEQTRIWGNKARSQSENYVIVDSGEGFKVLRGIRKPNGDAPDAVQAKKPNSNSYCIETRYRHSPNYARDKGKGGKFGLGFSGGTYANGQAPMDAAESGNGGAVLTAVSDRGLIRDYLYEYGDNDYYGAMYWRKANFDAAWHTLRYCAWLNTPGQRNGRYQVVFDGVKVVDKSDIYWRPTGKTWQWNGMRLHERDNNPPKAIIYNEYQYHRMWVPQ